MCRTARLSLTLSLLCLAAMWAGCADPYSQNRIQRRNAHRQSFVEGCAESERRRPTRLREAREMLRDWYRSDCERFNKRAPTVGDYVL